MNMPYLLDTLERRLSLSAAAVTEFPFADYPDLARQGHAQFATMGHTSVAKLDAASSPAETELENRVAAVDTSSTGGFLEQSELDAAGRSHAEFVSMGHTSVAELDAASSLAETEPQNRVVDTSSTSGFLEQSELEAAGRSHAEFVSMGHISVADLEAGTTASRSQSVSPQVRVFSAIPVRADSKDPLDFSSVELL